jgi:quinol monooxygenase YgiN
MKKMQIVKWVMKQEEAGAVLAMLPELAEKSRAEKGNVSYSVFQAVDDPNVLILYECYANQEALEAHRRAEHYERIAVNQIRPRLAAREVMEVTEIL